MSDSGSPRSANPETDLEKGNAAPKKVVIASLLKKQEALLLLPKTTRSAASAVQRLDLIGATLQRGRMEK